jgi:hypothetical protein
MGDETRPRGGAPGGRSRVRGEKQRAAPGGDAQFLSTGNERVYSLGRRTGTASERFHRTEK